MLCFDVSANWRESVIRTNVAAGESDIRVLRIMWGGMIPRVSLRFTLGYEPLASLGHSTFQVVLAVWFYHVFSRMLCGLVLPRIYTNNDHGFTQLRL